MAAATTQPGQRSGGRGGGGAERGTSSTFKGTILTLDDYQVANTIVWGLTTLNPSFPQVRTDSRNGT